MQNEGRDCKYCRVVEIDHLPSIPVYLFFDLNYIKYSMNDEMDEFVCDNCVVKLYRRYIELIRENKRLIEEEEDRIRPFMIKIHKLSKRKLLEILNKYRNYIHIIRNDVNDEIFDWMEYKNIKKSEMIYQIKQHDIIEDLCHFIDTLE